MIRRTSQARRCIVAPGARQYMLAKASDTKLVPKKRALLPYLDDGLKRKRWVVYRVIRAVGPRIKRNRRRSRLGGRFNVGAQPLLSCSRVLA